jgi:hypothetical protein
VPQPRTDWVAAMITPTTVAVVLGGVAVLPGGRKDAGRRPGCRGEAWLKKGLLSSK